jgi:hypothetical protein
MWFRTRPAKVSASSAHLLDQTQQVVIGALSNLVDIGNSREAERLPLRIA